MTTIMYQNYLFVFIYNINKVKRRLKGYPTILSLGVWIEDDVD